MINIKNKLKTIKQIDYNGMSEKDLINYSLYYNIRLDSIENIDNVNNLKIGNYIINLDKNYSRNGTHWVSLINLKDIIFYFDPFGIKPPIKFNLKTLYNNIQFQEINEKYCGLYSLMFLYFGENIKDDNDFEMILEELKNYEIKD